MVSTRFESMMFKPWRSVERPAIRSIAAVNRAPETAPKPGGKVLVYVYENSEDPTAQQAVLANSNGALPPNTQLVFNGMPESNSLNEEYELETLNGDSTVNKLRSRAKKAGKGYKLLADVNNGNLKGSSRGGRMFMKQKQRMGNYTSLPRSGMMREELEDDYQEQEEEKSHVSWNGRKMSPAAVKYHPSPSYQNSTHKKWKKGNDQILPPLRSPPPEWRAKVDSDYNLYYNEALPNQRWNSVGKAQNPYFSRSESAPLPSENLEDETSAMEEDRQKSESVIGMNYDARTDASRVVVNFDAKKHIRAPHRQQGARAGRGVFTTTPHIQYDFNARAVGWSKAYAQQY